MAQVPLQQVPAGPLLDGLRERPRHGGGALGAGQRDGAAGYREGGERQPPGPASPLSAGSRRGSPRPGTAGGAAPPALRQVAPSSRRRRHLLGAPRAAQGGTAAPRGAARERAGGAPPVSSPLPCQAGPCRAEPGRRGLFVCRLPSRFAPPRSAERCARPPDVREEMASPAEEAGAEAAAGGGGAGAGAGSGSGSAGSGPGASGASALRCRAPAPVGGWVGGLLGAAPRSSPCDASLP